MVRHIVKYLGLALVASLFSFQVLRSLKPPVTIKAIVPVSIISEELVGPPEHRLEVHTLFAVRSDGARANKTLTTGKNPLVSGKVLCRIS